MKIKERIKEKVRKQWELDNQERKEEQFTKLDCFPSSRIIEYLFESYQDSDVIILERTQRGESIKITALKRGEQYSF